MLNLLEKQLPDIVAQQAERGLAALSHVGAECSVSAARNPHLASLARRARAYSHINQVDIYLNTAAGGRASA